MSNIIFRNICGLYWQVDGLTIKHFQKQQIISYDDIIGHMNTLKLLTWKISLNVNLCLKICILWVECMKY